MGTRIALGAVIFAAATASLLAMLHDPAPADDEKRGQARKAPTGNLATWAGIELPLPRGWRVVDTSDGARTWASPDRSGTVTIGSVPASDAPLATIVASTRQELATTPTYQPGESREHHLRGGRAIVHGFVTGTSPTVRVEQMIARGLVEGRDVIVTATATIGDPAPRPELMSVRRGR